MDDDFAGAGWPRHQREVGVTKDWIDGLLDFYAPLIQQSIDPPIQDFNETQN